MTQIDHFLSLDNRVAIITGAATGLGAATAQLLSQAGARVVINHIPGQETQAQAVAKDCPNDSLCYAADITNDEECKGMAQAAIQQWGQIDILINNAGIMACPEARVGNNWESQFGVNHIGHFVLTQKLLPLLQNAGSARVVCLSSIAHRRSDILWDDIHFESTDYEKWTAYAQAKTANALFALALDMKYRDQGIQAFSVHPGGILTPLQRHLPNEEMMALGWTDADGNLSEQVAAMFKSTTQGCTTTLWAATSDALADTGGLYCEDCNVSNLATEDSPRFCDVAPWAVSEESANRLWDLTEKMLAE